MLESPQIFGLLLLVLFLSSFWKPQLYGFVLASLLGAVYLSQVPDGAYAAGEFFKLDFSPYRKLFGAIVSGLGCLIGLYSHSYFRSVKTEGRFFGVLGLFQWSCLFLIFSDHILSFVTAWELTSITSFLLIGYKLSSNAAQRGAYQALIVTSFGGLCMFAGLLLLGTGLETYSISEMIGSPGAIYANENLFLIFCLIFLGIITKSAQLPFHFWLPDAMLAPTPVSAYLHSATLVKLGVFAAGLFWPIFNVYLPWHLALSGVGLLSFAWGAVGALFQRDLKAGLAYTTFSQLGLILMLFGQRIPEAFYAACTLVLAHALYKSSLFLIVGILADGTKTQDIRKMSGFLKSKPALCLASCLAAASMAGVPFFLGFLGKEYALSIVLRPFPSLGPKIFTLVTFSIGVIATVAFACFFIWKPFFENFKKKNPAKLPEFSNALTSVVLPLSVLSLVLGVFFDPIRQAFLKVIPDVNLDFFYSNPLVLWVSLGMLALGILLGAGLLASKRFWEIDWPNKLEAWRASKVFQKISFLFLPWLSMRFKRFFEQSSWTYGLLLSVAFAASVLIFLLPGVGELKLSFRSNVDMELSLLILLAGGMALLTTLLRDPGVQIFVGGVVGLTVAFSYAVYGAPDLVLTQILVETASLVLLILGYINLKKPNKALQESPLTQVVSWTSALCLSAAVILCFLALDGSGTSKFASRYFFENAVPLTHGGNLVNVVLVDFRGIDTMVETSVLAIAYFASLALCTRLKSFSTKVPTHPHLTQWIAKLSKAFFWALSIVAIIFLLRGHNAPGGGFIGGLLFGLAIFVRMLSSGWSSRGVLLSSIGLVLVYLTAILPAFDSSILTSYYYFGLSSSLAFDLGVFLVVSGSVAGIFEILLRLKAKSWSARRWKDA